MDDKFGIMWQYTYAFAVTGFVVLWLSLLDISMLVIMYCHVVICYPSLVLRLSINSVLTVYRNEGKAGEMNDITVYLHIV